MAATLADITCDSDGVLNRFISTREGVDHDPILPLHELHAGEPYHLAMFLTGKGPSVSVRPAAATAAATPPSSGTCRGTRSGPNICRNRAITGCR